MIGPRVDDIPISEKRSNNTVAPLSTADQSKVRAIKRKLFDDGKDRESMCNTAQVEVIVVNGRLNTSQTIPSIVSEMRNISFREPESANNCVSWSDRINYKPGDILNYKHDDCSGPKQIFLNVDATETDSDSSIDPLNPDSLTPMIVEESTCQHSENDNEASNLSWLLNFKVDSLFNSTGMTQEHNYQEDSESKEGTVERKNNSDINRGFLSDSNDNVEKIQSQHSTVKFFKPSRYLWAKKPPFTYTELIEQALREKGELTVSGIYNWISEHFPFYKANDDRWKNSVRHNLSINPHFRKGSKAPHGAGHLWTVAHKDGQSRYSVKKQQRITQFMSDMVTPDELEAATASIEENKENRATPEEVNITENNQHAECFITEIFNTNQGGVSLEQSAEQILSGVKKEVEVQYLIPIHEKTVQKTDFLNPVSKDVVVQESGLLDRVGDLEGSYLITDLNPITLDLNMADNEIVTTDDNLFPEEMGFHYYEFTSQSPQVQV